MPSRIIVYLISALFAAALAQSELLAGGPQNLLVVVNDNSQESLDVANYYRLKRRIPGSCLVHVKADPVHDYQKADFERDILLPVSDHIARHGLAGQIRFVVFTKGLPYRIRWNAETLVSVTTPAAAMSMSIGHMNNQPYFRGDSAFRGLNGMPFLSVCLTGYTVEDVKRCIDQGVASDGTMPKGTIYLFDGVGPRSRVHPAYGRQEAIEFLEKNGIKFEVREGHSLNDEQGVLGYWTGFTRVTTKGIGFLPGALADHLTSFGGILFDNKSQMSILDFIREGVTGSYGTVMEPTNIPSRHSQGWLFNRYVSGLTMAESYWSSVQDVQIGVFVGEPLARPFAKPVAVSIEGADPRKPVSGKILLNISARPSDPAVRLRDLSWWVDGRPFRSAVSVSALAGAEASLSVAGREFKAALDPATGIEGLAAALAAAVESDAELSGPDGIRAKALGRSIVLTARSPGPARNGAEIKIGFPPPGDQTALLASPTATALAGGAETAEIPASVEITLNNKDIAAGDTLVIVAGKERFVAVADEADVKSADPLVFIVKKIMTQMEKSKFFGAPRAGGINNPKTRVVLTLTSAKSCAEGNGDTIEVAFTKAKDSKLSVHPTGKLTMDGGARREFFATASLEIIASTGAVTGAQFELDTNLLPDGPHELRLVAEEDTRAAAQGFAVANIRVHNGGGKFALKGPAKLDFSRPVTFTSTLGGAYPGGYSRIVLLLDGREIGEFDKSKKFVFKREEHPLGAGRHVFQAKVEPKTAQAREMLSDEIEAEIK